MAVLAADIQDRDAAVELFDVIQSDHPQLQCIWADGQYQGGLEDYVARHYPWRMVIVHKLAEQKGFVVLHRRWVVERTFAWLCRNRRLSKDYEENVESSEAWLFAAMTHILVRRLAAA